MKSWYEIYKDRMNERYQNHIKVKYAPFIKELVSQTALRYVEIGCGAGNITKVLRNRVLMGDRVQFTLLDTCPKMLGLAIENNVDDRCTFHVRDAKKFILRSHNIKLDTLVHSHGLLEHFEDEDIRQMVSIASHYSSQQIHFVPGHRYEVPSRGDERLMTPAQWLDILQPLNLPVVLEEFNDGFDYMIKIGD